MKYLSPLSACLLVPSPGYIGTMDSLQRVEGYAPADATCLVSLRESGTAERISEETVRGAFSVAFIASGPFPGDVDIICYCNGKKVREILSVPPRSRNKYEVGKLEP
jgi:hypothetical protein